MPHTRPRRLPPVTRRFQAEVRDLWSDLMKQAIRSDRADKVFPALSAMLAAARLPER